MHINFITNNQMIECIDYYHLKNIDANIYLYNYKKYWNIINEYFSEIS